VPGAENNVLLTLYRLAPLAARWSANRVIRFIRQAARIWRRFFCCYLTVSNFRSPVGLNLLLMPGEHDLQNCTVCRTVEKSGT
jgi:hypothetical protein